MAQLDQLDHIAKIYIMCANNRRIIYSYIASISLHDNIFHIG